MGYLLDNYDSKACLEWDTLEKLVVHQAVNESAREGTYGVDTALENVLE